MLDFTSYNQIELQKLTRFLIVAFLVSFLVAGALGINFISSMANGAEGIFKANWNQTFQPILVNLMSSAVGVLVAAWLFSFRTPNPPEDRRLTETLQKLDAELTNLRGLLEREREAKFTMADLQFVLAEFSQKDKAHSSNLKTVSKNITAVAVASKDSITNGSRNAKNKTNS